MKAIRNHAIIIGAIVLTTACGSGSRFLVTGLGYEPGEYTGNTIYSLPRSHIKITVHYEKEVFVPGPYGDYAMKLLGISDVRRERSVRYSISQVTLGSSVEADAEHLYAINILEGSPDLEILDKLEESKLILRHNWYDDAAMLRVNRSEERVSGIPFRDVTMEPNIETRTETIYKTIITDTSFIEVPVQTEQLEQKTLERKAQEAARFILELRADRYYLAGGLLDPYPQELDLNTALEKMDELESDYLSLFLGKSYTLTGSREYIVTPDSQPEAQDFLLDRFSEKYGFVSSDDAKQLQLTITPSGITRSLRNLMPQFPETEVYNRIYYRMPEMIGVSLELGDMELYFKSIPVFQMGALVNEKIVAGE